MPEPDLDCGTRRLHPAALVRRRFASLLLTALIALMGVAVGACPLGRCLAVQPAASAGPHAGHGHAGHEAEATPHAGHAMHDAHAGMHDVADASTTTSHACCDRDGIANPPCCPETGQLTQQKAAPSSDRPSHAMQLVATRPVPARLASFATAALDPPRPVPLGAPPGTLIAQHTSLLV